MQLTAVNNPIRYCAALVGRLNRGVAFRKFGGCSDSVDRDCGNSRDHPTRRSRPCQCGSRRATLFTLPTGVSGNESMNSKLRGNL